MKVPSISTATVTEVKAGLYFLVDVTAPSFPHE
jgi:hypothetical protein